jgi:hypothetical protein
MLAPVIPTTLSERTLEQLFQFFTAKKLSVQVILPFFDARGLPGERGLPGALRGDRGENESMRTLAPRLAFLLAFIGGTGEARQKAILRGLSLPNSRLLGLLEELHARHGPYC